jgi:hypothetical protein
MVQQHMDRFRQRQMKLHELTQQGLEESADYFHERDEKYSTSELRFPAVVNICTDDDAAFPAQTTFGERMECLDIDDGISQMLHGPSRPGSSHIRIGSD